MAQGLQCWDEHARLVVDIGDYNMRFMGTASLRITSGTSWSVGFSGMRPTGWMAVQQYSEYYNSFYCIPGTNAFTVQLLPTDGVSPRTIYFDVYSYA
ncbi:MAG: hypothetical protein K0S95_758 [Pantoea eucrina]|jgi:hypothetical protein|nr:hypothetical protein [Pantoea eucrina]